MNEVFQAALAYINSKAVEHIADPERGLRELIHSHRVVALAAVKSPSLSQLQALKIYPGLDHLNLLQLRQGLEAGTLRLDAIPEEFAKLWASELAEAGFACSINPLNQTELESRLKDAGLPP